MYPHHTGRGARGPRTSARQAKVRADTMLVGLCTLTLLGMPNLDKTRWAKAPASLLVDASKARATFNSYEGGGYHLGDLHLPSFVVMSQLRHNNQWDAHGR